MFTGNGFRQFLYQILNEVSFVKQSHSSHRSDDLALANAMIIAILHCALASNKPTTEEITNCQAFPDRTFDLLGQLRAVLALSRMTAQRLGCNCGLA